MIYFQLGLSFTMLAVGLFLAWQALVLYNLSETKRESTN